MIWALLGVAGLALTWFVFVRKSKPPVYAIEHYPESGFYVATVNGWCLKRDYFTGIVRRAPYNDLVFADTCHNREDAMRLIAMYKEQRIACKVEVVG